MSILLHLFSPQITTIGRYGMSTAKCKIPVGSYYGHTLVLPGDDYADKNAAGVAYETNIKVSSRNEIISDHEIVITSSLYTEWAYVCVNE